MELNKIYQGDALEVIKTFPGDSIDCVTTSPPYWALRDYGVEGQLGLEPTFQEYINKLCDIFDEVKRVLKKEGTCWVNMGDTYSATRWTGNGKGQPMNKFKDGHRDIAPQKVTPFEDKCLCQIPSRFAIEMCNRGWILRNEIIWHKPNCMPSSVKDRFTVDFEKLFFFVKSKKYYFETQYEKALTAGSKHIAKRGDKCSIIKETVNATYFDRDYVTGENRNKRAVWSITTKPFKAAHFATYPEALIETPIKAGCPIGGIALDPFMGSGTTAVVSKKLGRNYIGIELNPDYIKLAEKRLSQNLLNLNP